MKYRAPLLCILLAAAAAWLAAVPGALAQVVPEMFNYQGRLVDENGLVNGVRTMVFRLYNAQTGGDVVFIETQQVTVVDGLYSVQVGDNPDYGSLRDALTNAELWLEVAIGTNTLSPRERVISVMYALMADRVTTGAITTAMLADGAVTTAKLDDGAVSSDKILDGTVQDADLAANSVDGSKVIDGSLTAADVDPATFSNTFWKLDGNAGTDESTHYLGTSDSHPLVVRVNGVRAVRIEPAPLGRTPNIIGGHESNFVPGGVVGAFIGGGGDVASSNVVADDYGVVVGGFGNTAGDLNRIGPESRYCFMGAGYENTISNWTYYSSLLGGQFNAIHGDADWGAIVAGRGNVIHTNADYAFIAGGYTNCSAVCGGQDNRNAGYGCFVRGGVTNYVDAASDGSAILGGFDNEILNANMSAIIGADRCMMMTNCIRVVILAGGSVQVSNVYCSVVGGNNVQVTNSGCFIWADSQWTTFRSLTNDEVAFRCLGGVRFTSGSSASNQTVSWKPGQSSWQFSSDRDLKENVRPVDTDDILRRVEQLPITEWNFKGYSQRHIGPMAQDFHRLFPLNDNDRSIDSGDLQGVTLAAVKGLIRRNAELEERVAEREKIVNNLLDAVGNRAGPR